MALALLFMLVLAGPPAFAASDPTAATGPLSAMNYFIGSWNCTGGPVGPPPGKATILYEVETGNIIQESIDVAPAGKSPGIHYLTAYSYDAKKHRIYAAGVDAMGGWGVSWTAGWKGDVLAWTDVVTSDGDLGRGTITKAGATAYNILAYAKVKGVEKVVLKVHCDKAPPATPK